MCHSDVHCWGLKWWACADSNLLGQPELKRGRAEVTSGLLDIGDKRRPKGKCS